MITFIDAEEDFNKSQFRLIDFEEERKNITLPKYNKKDNDDMKFKDGKIRQRKNNTFEVRYRKDDYNISFYGKTKAEAMQKFKTWFDTVSPKKTVQKKITLDEWIETWLTTYKKGKVKDTTLQAIKYVLKHLSNSLGKKELHAIKNIDLQTMLNNMSNYGNTTHKVKVYTQNIFLQATRNKLIKDNPAENLEIPKSKTIHSQALSIKEQQKLIDFQFNDIELHYFYCFCLYTGCRRAEALKFNLQCDIENDYIHIKGTKTTSSDRTIPYFDTIKSLFVNIKELSFDNLKEDYVTRKIKDCLPNHTVRDLRKTFATNCHEMGVSGKVVQKWLGHTNLDMTMNTYTAVRSEFELSEALKLTPKLTPKK